MGAVGDLPSQYHTSSQFWFRRKIAGAVKCEEGRQLLLQAPAEAAREVRARRRRRAKLRMRGLESSSFSGAGSALCGDEGFLHVDHTGRPGPSRGNPQALCFTSSGQDVPPGGCEVGYCCLFLELFR